MCILYLRCEDAVLPIQCTSLPITTTIAGQWFNSLILFDGIKCTVANGQIMIHVGPGYIAISHDDYSFCTKKIWEMFLWLWAVSYD